MIGLGSDNNGGYFGGDREGKESYIIIVGVWPLNVLRDILLLGSSHQHHCKHTHPPTPHNFRHYHHLCCHYQYHPNQYNHHIIIYSIIITVASATIIFQSKPYMQKAGDSGDISPQFLDALASLGSMLESH